MAPNDETRTSAETRRNSSRPAGSGAFPPPHQNGNTPNVVNPFHLAIAELQADHDDMNVEPPQLAPTENPPARQTIMLTQPVRALGLRSWLAVGALALSLGLIGGLVVSAFSGHDRATSTTPPAPPDPDPAVLKELETLKTRAGDLSKQVEGLRDTIEVLSKPVPAPDLSGLKDQLAQLTKLTESLAPVPGRIHALDVRAAELAEAIASLRTESRSLRGKVDSMEKLVKSTAARAVAAPEPPARDERAPATPGLAQGVDLFKKGKYKEALSVFNKLELTTPDDARVWYFAALSHGLTTNQWGGGTAELVQIGIKREQAGTPDSALIDAALRDLTSATGKDWLDEYRKRAK